MSFTLQDYLTAKYTELFKKKEILSSCLAPSSFLRFFYFDISTFVKCVGLTPIVVLKFSYNCLRT